MLSDLLYKLRRARNWPAADGTIVSCKWDDPTTTNTGASNAFRRGSGRGWYTATFSYRINGEYYGGEFTVLGGENSEAPYREGDKLVVHYDPRRPEKNFHEGSGSISAKTLQILTTVAIFVVVLIFEVLRAR